MERIVSAVPFLWKQGLPSSAWRTWRRLCHVTLLTWHPLRHVMSLTSRDVVRTPCFKILATSMACHNRRQQHGQPTKGVTVPVSLNPLVFSTVIESAPTIAILISSLNGLTTVLILPDPGMENAMLDRVFLVLKRTCRQPASIHNFTPNRHCVHYAPNR